MLAALARAGWLSRIRRGVYLILPLEAASGEVTTLTDAWAVASVLYAPCYIAGWSAAEHWGLTEQLFRSIFVATGANIRSRNEDHLGARFHLTKLRLEKMDGLATVWRASMQVRVSGPERTLVDAGVAPAWVGGTRHLGEMLGAYRELGGANENALSSELELYGNGAAAKRLGYLCERLWPSATYLISRCSALKSEGTAKLDPAVRARGRLVTRWGIWENVRVTEQGHS